MANLGNVWHLAANPEPSGTAGMRDPVFPTAPVAEVTIWTGNQFQGGGNAGNQLQDGSTVFFRLSTAVNWTPVPLLWGQTVANNKYYSAAIPTAALEAGVVIEYYLRIAYGDHDTTFLHSAADGIASQTVADEGLAQAQPFTFTVDTSANRGQWGSVFPLPNVAIHAHLLPSGLVLMWGRRDDPNQSLDVNPPSPLQPGAPPAPPAQCTPFLWNPDTGQVTATPRPMQQDGKTEANLFCSGHSFLADGRLLVAGGHNADGAGLAQTSIYDPAHNTWTPSAVMKHGRWYPMLTTLPDGSVVIMAGTFRDPAGPASIQNTAPEVWKDGTLTEIIHNPEGAFDLYPRIHVASSGLIFTTGSLQQAWTLDISGGGHWNAVATAVRANGQRDYAPSVLYELDKAIYIGGGNAPTQNAEMIDFSQAAPNWTDATAMGFPRRQHNATILPDGTVLVTGGTRSGGNGPPENFNNLDSGQPVHIAELWDPTTGRWAQLGAETVDRCYHSTAVLLPDGRVLTAGGGEFFPVEATQQENAPADSHRDGQVFSPPYLFKGARPVMSSAPDTSGVGDTFHVVTAQAAAVAKVTLIRLSTVTHSFNTGQRFASLAFQAAGDGLDVTMPTSANVSPPGVYMLFLVSHEGVPSVAKIIQITAGATAIDTAAQPQRRLITVDAAPAPEAVAPQDAFALRDSVLSAATGTKVVVGLTGTCPYGISACWGGANEALRKLDGIELVDPIPDGEHSTATVFLVDDRLPLLTRWKQEFHSIVNDSYELRGIEVTATGAISMRNGRLFLGGDTDRTEVLLAPLDPSDKVQWDRAARAPLPARPEETDAYARLQNHIEEWPDAVMTVIGPLVTTDEAPCIEIREFEHHSA
jgi:hypothetical protein